MLTEQQLLDNKQYIIKKLEKAGQLRNDSVNMTKFIEWLCSTDFFLAPASTHYHNAYSGGLAEHSIIVYKHLEKIITDYNINNIPEDSKIICGLMHDVCKVDTYVNYIKNQLNPETKQWEQVFAYKKDAKLPLGHGSKSIYYMQKYFLLTDEEAMAIKWHMGTFDMSPYEGHDEMCKALEISRLTFCMHMADMNAVYLGDING